MTDHDDYTPDYSRDYYTETHKLAARKGATVYVGNPEPIVTIDCSGRFYGWDDWRDVYVWAAGLLGVALVMDDNGDYWEDDRTHWHYYWHTGGYMPDTVTCLHDSSDTQALECLRDRVREYVDDYACTCGEFECECAEDRYTPTDQAESVAYGVADSELHDIGDVASGSVSVPVNEWDFATIERARNADCECYADFTASPDTHECAW